MDLLKKMFIRLLSFDGSLVPGSIKCISLNNRPCQARPRLVDINSNEPLYYPFLASVTKCDVSNINIKVYNLMLLVNEARFLIKHESCECKCRLNENVTYEKK